MRLAASAAEQSTGRNAMSDKGRSDRAKKEAQKKPQKTAKEKRTEKREKKSRSEY